MSLSASTIRHQAATLGYSTPKTVWDADADVHVTFPAHLADDVCDILNAASPRGDRLNDEQREQLGKSLAAIGAHLHPETLAEVLATYSAVDEFLEATAEEVAAIE